MLIRRNISVFRKLSMFIHLSVRETSGRWTARLKLSNTNIPYLNNRNNYVKLTLFYIN